MRQTETVFMDHIENIHIESPENLQIIKNAIHSIDDEVRLEAYRKLELFTFNSYIQQLLCQGLTDEDEIIRSDCLEILGEFDLLTHLDNIFNALQDSSHFVVNSAIKCLSDLEDEQAQEKAIEVLHNLLNNTFKSGVILRIHFALYVLDPDYSVDHLLDCLIGSKDYRDRCAVFNLLSEFCYEEDEQHILARVKQLIRPDDYRAVINDLAILTKELSQIGK
jgi:hypothetical protein